MDYQGTIIRPPNEGDSILLEITTGCSHNKCTFCGAFQRDRFTLKDRSTILRDIASAARDFPTKRRVFLCGGDALITPHKRLVGILEALREGLPRRARVGIYGNAKSLRQKTVEELRELKALGLSAVYMGLESGDDETLRAVCKDGDSADLMAQGRKVRAAGLTLSVTVLLGIAGPQRSDVHARETGRVLSAMDPNQVGALTLMLIPGTPLHDDFSRGDFTLPDAPGMLRELRTMLEHTHLTRGLFMANHASNYLPLKIRLPGGKDDALARIDQALAGDVRLKDEWARGL